MLWYVTLQIFKLLECNITNVTFLWHHQTLAVLLHHQTLATTIRLWRHLYQTLESYIFNVCLLAV